MSGLVVRLGSGGVGFGGRGGFWDGFGEEDAGELIVDLIEELLNPASRYQQHDTPLTPSQSHSTTPDPPLRRTHVRSARLPLARRSG
jgi:hypothetical protein